MLARCYITPLNIRGDARGRPSAKRRTPVSDDRKKHQGSRQDASRGQDISSGYENAFMTLCVRAALHTRRRVQRSNRICLCGHVRGILPILRHSYDEGQLRRSLKPKFRAVLGYVYDFILLIEMDLSKVQDKSFRGPSDPVVKERIKEVSQGTDKPRRDVFVAPAPRILYTFQDITPTANLTLAGQTYGYPSRTI